MQTQTLPIPYQAARVALYPNTTGRGVRVPQIDRYGASWLGTVELVLRGERGASLARVTLHPAHARDLAVKLTRQADFAEARARGEAGPCLCSAWSHNLYPCANDAALDYEMCRACWSPESGQSALGMGHGEP